MKFTGVFKKMQTEYLEPVQYYLDSETDFINVNQLIGKNLRIEHKANQCFNCGLDKPIFRMGYCQTCFFEVPQTAGFILRPEESKAHLNEEERDLEWERKMQLQPHIVYLANTGGVKVGVTRKTQLPTRWIDQGAIEALPILEVENRYLAGISEVELAKHIADKTNYRKMLSSNIQNADLYETRNELIQYLPEETKNSVLEEAEIVEIDFPVTQIPDKIKSLTLDKNPVIQGELAGIKGQYLIFRTGEVFNVRNHEGYGYLIEFGG